MKHHEYMYIPIKQWTLSCRLMRRNSSKSEKSCILRQYCTWTASGISPLKIRRRHALVLVLHTWYLNGPVSTHVWLGPFFMPSPPKPARVVAHTGLFQGLCAHKLHSQYGTVTLQSIPRRKFSSSKINHLCQGRNCSTSWMPFMNSSKWTWTSLLNWVFQGSIVVAIDNVWTYLFLSLMLMDVNSFLIR